MRIGEKAGLLQGTKQIRDAFGDALLEVARANDRVVALDGDLSTSTGTSSMRKVFPDRFFNIGIAEGNLVSVSAGLAANGFIPFVGSLACFLLSNGYDQLRQQVAIAGLNVKLLGSHAGISTGREGPTSHAIDDLALMGGLPGVVILVPSDETAMLAAVRTAVDYFGPVYIRSSRGEFPRIYADGQCSGAIGKANVVRSGKDVTFVACGLMVGVALDAAAALEEKGIDVRVIDMMSVKPVDREVIIAAAHETRAIVSLEEHLVRGGMGAAIAQVVAEEHPVPMRFIGIRDTYMESGSVEELMVRHHFAAEDVVKAAEELVAAKRREG
jgi:transketolase